jgi:hypothetical protein
MLSTYEKFSIYEISKQNRHLNYNFTEIHNHIYDLIVATYQNIGNYNNNRNISPTTSISPPQD